MAKKQEIQDKRYELYERAHTKEYYAVAKWLSEVKFAPAVFGADQADVWRKIEKLCELYEDALNAERARNAKLERKLRSLTVGKRPEPQAKPEPPRMAPAPVVPQPPKPQTAAPVAAEKREAPVQLPAEATPEKVDEPKSVEQKPEPVKPEPPKSVEAKAEKPASQEEEILLDLLREFGPGQGGKANG